MRFKFKCPQDASHKRFATTAHDLTWEMDENGAFTGTISTDETLAGPHPDNIWTCLTCYAEAVLAEKADMFTTKKRVRISLSALTRVEFTRELEVNSSIADDPEALQELANRIYEDTDGGEYTDDPHYWEKGSVQAEVLSTVKSGSLG